ncbi:hypothetical protein GGF46_005329 [Coemansia sp. RSA 552]|nr:hypothetical protein GGF46_005329 [Coemansia sp. RSA 552]
MVQVFGYISVQPDWQVDVANARRGVEGTHRFWASAYCSGKDSVHGTVQVDSAQKADDSPTLTTEGGVSAEYVGPRQLRLSCEGLGIPPELYSAPRQTLTCTNILRATGVRAFDVSQFGSLLVAGGDDGVLDVYHASTGEHRVRLDGHVGDITCCAFFPSGQVVLSGASDMRLKIWSASDGSNPVTLVGHTAAITDVAIIAVGKQVLSAAKDGTVRMWTCADASLNHTFELSDMPINAIHLAGRTVAVACEDGRAMLVDLDEASPAVEFGSTGGPPVRALAYDSENHLLVTGRSDAVVDVWSAKDPGSGPTYSFSRGQAPVSAVHLVYCDAALPHVCVATEDGQLYLVELTTTNGQVAGATVVEDLVAFDVDPISQVRVTPSSSDAATRQDIWAAAQDSRVCRF